jgi:uncharacterized membrane protein (UPF0127 family)
MIPDRSAGAVDILVRMRRVVVLVSLVAALASGCSSHAGPLPTSPAGSGALPVGRLTVGSAGAALRVRIASDDASRRRGLMGVRTLPPNEGMVFLYPSPTTVRFWMRETVIPLAIAFWGPGGRIVSIREMTPCHVDPCPLYGAGRPFLGAVEANAGYFARNHVRIGDRVVLTRSA